MEKQRRVGVIGSPTGSAAIARVLAQGHHLSEVSRDPAVVGEEAAARVQKASDSRDFYRMVCGVPGCGVHSSAGRGITGAVEKAIECGFGHRASDDKWFCPVRHMSMADEPGRPIPRQMRRRMEREAAKKPHERMIETAKR